MDQVRQILRYVLPGFVYVVLTGIGLFVVFPEWVVDQLNLLVVKDSLGPALSGMLAIGALGYVFATIHHWVHWKCGWLSGGVLDHSPFIKRMIDHELIDRESTVVDRAEAEPLSYALWCQCMGTGSIGEAADKKVSSLGDQTHGFGAARVASAFAVLTTVLVCWKVGTFSFDLQSAFRFLAMLALGVFATICFHYAYRRVGNTAQRMYERSLEAALSPKKQHPANPITPAIPAKPHYGLNLMSKDNDSRRVSGD